MLVQHQQCVILQFKESQLLDICGQIAETDQSSVVAMFAQLLDEIGLTRLTADLTAD